MDVEITIEDIRAAQQGAEWAQELVLGALSDRIGAAAYSEAGKFRGADFWDVVDEFKHVATIGAFEALGRFTGDTVDAYFAFMQRTAQSVIVDHCRERRFTGADADSIKAFTYWIRECGGDVDLAEKLCQRSADPAGRRLGRDRANAARLAYQGALALDMPVHPDWGESGPATYADILVSDLGIPDEFLTADDVSQRARALRIELVRAVLDSMGEISGSVLRATFGIDPYGEYGTHANAEIGALIGRTGTQVVDARKKGYRQFAKKFIALVAHDAADAELWWAAFNAERGKSNVSTGKARARVATAA